MVFVNQYVNIPQGKKNIDCHDIIDYWPTCIKDGLNWLSLLDIMKYTEDRIYNEVIILPSLLNML